MAPRSRTPAPTLEAELALAASLGISDGSSPAGANNLLIGGCDEVGRGALAGPVSVGMVVIDPSTAELLEDVRDSKLLKVATREGLVPLIRDWAVGYGVGHAAATEIDELGIVGALRLAGNRAWAQLAHSARPQAVLLDGNHDWLSAPGQPELLTGAGVGAAAWAPSSYPFDASGTPVSTRIKGDLHCLSVAAASVLAKVERDGLMATYDELEPHYGWAINKGYGTATHRQAIGERGATDYHRRSWRLRAPAATR